MKEQGHTQRSLGRAWRPSNPESGRRNIFKYVREGQEPGGRIVAELACVLGVPKEELDGGLSDDEEESDFVSAVNQLAAVAASLAALADKVDKRKKSAA